MPQYCSQKTVCVHNSPGKTRECPVACRAPRFLDKTTMFVYRLKSFTNTVWHQISNFNLYLCLSCPRRISGRIHLNLHDLLFPRDNIWKENSSSSFHNNFGVTFLTYEGEAFSLFLRSSAWWELVKEKIFFFTCNCPSV